MTFVSYLYWHYTAGLQSLIATATEFINALADIFSINYLVLTLFYPWHRYVEPYKRGFYISELIWTFSQNAISRVMGAVVRFITVVIGSTVSLFGIIIGLCLIGLWVAMPIVIPGLFVAGVIFLF